MIPRPGTPRELAVLRHPDRKSAWSVVLKLEVQDPISITDSAIERAAARWPILLARWRRGSWVPATAPRIQEAPLSALVGSFDLAHEPALRISCVASNLYLVGHHAAFDGRGLVTIAGELLGAGGTSTQPERMVQPSEPNRNVMPTAGHSIASRLRRPCSRVIASPDAQAGEEFLSRSVALAGPNLTARLAAGAAAAVAQRHRLMVGREIGPLGISVGVGGSESAGNTASYRRVDLPANAHVADVIEKALRSSDLPPELKHPTRLLRFLGPVARRLSDTFLVSNLGRVDIPGVTRLEFYPVARGRSAVAFGAVGLAGGPSTLTLRSLYLSPSDAEALLDDVVRRIEASD